MRFAMSTDFPVPVAPVIAMCCRWSVGDSHGGLWVVVVMRLFMVKPSVEGRHDTGACSSWRLIGPLNRRSIQTVNEELSKGIIPRVRRAARAMLESELSAQGRRGVAKRHDPNAAPRAKGVL